MFAGKTVVVTGAGSGIGRMLCVAFAKANANVSGLDVNEQGLEATADTLGRVGHKFVGRKVDVTDFASLAAMRDEICLANKGALDIWVNNAGVSGLGAFSELTLDTFMHVLQVNLGGVINGSRAALQVMEDRGSGWIVNMASIAGHLPAPYMSAYCASKHAVVGFTRALTAELELLDSPVRALLVSPGFVNTGMIQKGEALGFPEWLSFMLSRPEKVAQDVLRAIKKGKREVIPTLNGKLMRQAYGFFPETTVKSSKIMLTKSFSDLLFNRLAR